MFGRELRGRTATSGVRSSMLLSVGVMLQKFHFSSVNIAAEVLGCRLGGSDPRFASKIPRLPTVKTCEVWLLTDVILQ